MALSAGSEQGIAVVREMVSKGIISRYRLAREMGLSTPKVVNRWVNGEYFDEARLERLRAINEKYTRLFQVRQDYPT